MKKVILIIFTLLLCATAVTVHSKEIKSWVVKKGDSIVLQIKDVVRIAVGNSEIADATVVSSNEILVNGKTPGDTSLHVWTEFGRVLYRIKVEEKMPTLDRINQIEGLEGVETAIIGESIVLEGVVLTEDRRELAKTIADSFGKSVINLIQVSEKKALPQEQAPPPPEPGPSPTDQIKKVPGLEGVSLVKLGDGFVLGGSVATQHDREKAGTLAKFFHEKVVNLIEVTGSIQVLVKLELIEITQKLIDELGLNWASKFREHDPSTSVEVVGPNLFQNAFNIGIARTSLGEALNIRAMIQALHSKGDLKIISAPRLVTLSGQEAYVNMGGRVPIPSTTEIAASERITSIDWVDYGIQLNITPLVDRLKNINLKIESSVSDLDWANAVSGTPAFLEKKVSTAVTIKDGETIILGGLVNRSQAKKLDTVPLLSHLPVIGNLFFNRQGTEEHKELVVLITPQIISSAHLEEIKEPELMPDETERIKRLKEEMK
ncbi:MAG: pilus assembly protein N-terminal domain-containing protein [bacterium]|nr:pilus assembly protein N-terminal domain-containing protein [bacterium]